MAYLHAGRTAEATALLERVRDADVKRRADHPNTLITLGNLARAYWAAGKLEQALPLVQQAAAGFEERQFVDPAATSVIHDLIDWHERLKQYDQAEAWRRKWLAVVKERAGPESAACAGELVGLGRNLLLQQKPAEAEQTLRACLAHRTKQQPDDWRTFNTKSLLGDALLGQKKYADAEPLLKDGYTGMKERAAKIPPEWRRVRLTEARERLVRLYEATGKKDEAARWRKGLEGAGKAPASP